MEVLADLERRIDGGDFGSVSSLLVLREGVLVYERYWNGWQPTDLHRVYSVTKSVASLITGIAAAEHGLGPVDRPVVDLLPEYAGVVQDDERKGRITLEHALQMRAGFVWDELTINYADGSHPLVPMVTSTDWVGWVLGLPMASEPGASFAYHSGVSMLLSDVVEDVVGRTAADYAEETLLAPLDIQAWEWAARPDGSTITGWGLQLLPRDMAALGYLVVQDGRWQGQAIVPAPWLEDSAEPATRFTDGTGYGYQWWLSREYDTPSGGRERAYCAWGWGGQFIVALPAYGMVVVSTAENFAGGGLDPYTLTDYALEAAGVAAR